MKHIKKSLKLKSYSKEIVDVTVDDDGDLGFEHEYGIVWIHREEISKLKEFLNQLEENPNEPF